MKSFVFATFFLITNHSFSEIRPASTKESLAAKRAELAKQQRGKFIQPVAKEISVQTKTGGTSIMDSSSYLIGDRGYTLVPKGSVPNVGKSFSLASSEPKDVPYMSWNDFVRRHRNGLRILPVSQNLLTPEADTKFIQDQIASIRKLGITCITTYKQQPVRITHPTSS